MTVVPVPPNGPMRASVDLNRVMEYYQILNLTKEPFSNSPEPEFFYQSPQHVECLQNLEIAVRLRRGLNVVIGDVGTGKTTLCRRLIGQFEGDENIKTHLLLDSYFGDSIEFLSTVSRMFGLEEKPGNSVTEWQLKENIKNYLFEQGVDEQKTVVLIIDEGQKIPDFCMEILREFLNYETNEYKLLQIVIFAQNEFRKTLRKRSNFADRINFLYDLEPLNFKDTRLMIRYRMEKASKTGENPLHFTYPAMRAIYRATDGYPRKIVTLCHQIILTVIVQNRTRVRWSLVRACVHREVSDKARVVPWARVTVLSGVLVILLVLGLGTDQLKKLVYSNVSHLFKGPSLTEKKPVPLFRGSLLTEKKPVPFEVVKETKAEDIPVKELAGVAIKAKTEVTPDSALEASIALPYPAMLGKLAVKKRWIVSKMIAAVYGFCDPKHLRLVKEANPHIRNLNRVVAGNVINFPVIPAKSNPPMWSCFVQIAKGDDLGEAHRLLCKNSNKILPLRMLPYWNDREGLKFSILLKENFTDKKLALRAISELPPTVSSDAKIISEWGENTVFFAN